MKLSAGTKKPASGPLAAGDVATVGRSRLRAIKAVNGESRARTAAADSGKVNVHLSTHYRAAYGEKLKLVGSTPELGGWNVAKAPTLDWTEDHHWVTDVSLPKGKDIQFKVVLLSHSGVVWEPGSNRALGVLEDKAALAVKVAWGVPDIELVNAIPAGRAAEQSLSDQFDSLWDPTKAGLPADITADLDKDTNPAEMEKGPKQKHNVTLEPEWAVFDSDDEDELPVGAAEAIEAQQTAPQTQTAAPANEPEKSLQPVAALSETDGWESSGEGADFQGVPETVSFKEEAGEAAKTAEVAAKPKKVDGLKAAGQAAGYAVAGVAAAVVMSALAVDITDAAIASAVVAAGATLLPGAVDTDGRKKAIKGKGAASPLLGAVELGLKAQALVLGRGKKPEQPPAAVAPAEQEAPKEERETETDREDGLLPEYVRAKAQQAREFAKGFTPTEEELFETSPPPAFVRVEGYTNNAVSIEGLKRSDTSSRGDKVADKKQ